MSQIDIHQQGSQLQAGFGIDRLIDWHFDRSIEGSPRPIWYRVNVQSIHLIVDRKIQR